MKNLEICSKTKRQQFSQNATKIRSTHTPHTGGVNKVATFGPFKSIELDNRQVQSRNVSPLQKSGVAIFVQTTRDPRTPAMQLVIVTKVFHFSLGQAMPLNTSGLFQLLVNKAKNKKLRSAEKVMTLSFIGFATPKPLQRERRLTVGCHFLSIPFLCSLSKQTVRVSQNVFVRALTPVVVITRIRKSFFIFSA